MPIRSFLPQHAFDQEVIDVMSAAFNDASFQGATLKNVSFRLASLWSSGKRAMQSMNFDGAMMDKLTYAALKGLGADVSKVTVLS